MKKYNRERRATYKMHTRTHTYDIHDICDRYIHIHVHARYDGHKQTTYIAEYARGRDTHASTYVRMLNAINDTFPELNELHTEHIYMANAPYRQFVFMPTDIHAPEIEPYTYKYTDTRRAKCLIYNARDELVHMGIFKRTIHIYEDARMDIKEAHITLHNKAGDKLRVHAYVPSANTLHGHTVAELRKRGIEFYQYR